MCGHCFFLWLPMVRITATMQMRKRSERRCLVCASWSSVEAFPGTFSIGNGAIKMHSNRDDANQTTVATAAAAKTTNTTTAPMGHQRQHLAFQPRCQQQQQQQRTKTTAHDEGNNRNMGNHCVSNHKDGVASWLFVLCCLWLLYVVCCYCWSLLLLWLLQ